MEAINYPPLCASSFRYCEIGLCMSFKVKSLCFKKENEYYKTFMCSNCGTVCYLEVGTDKHYYLMNMNELVEKDKIDSSKISESFDIILYKDCSHEVKVQMDPHLEDVREEYLRKEKEAMENRIRIYVEQQEYLYRQKMEQSQKDLDLLTSQLCYDRSSFIRTVSDVTDSSITSVVNPTMNITPIQVSRPLYEKKPSITPLASYSLKNKIFQQQNQQEKNQRQQQQQQQLQNQQIQSKNNNGKMCRERSRSLPNPVFCAIKEKHYLPCAVFGMDDSDLSETESDNSDYDDDDDDDDDEVNNGEGELEIENKVKSLNIQQELISL